ncbi:MAG: Fe-S cluster assembly protein SufD [Caulobacter sp.]|nr:Fe-S cluster assembly protein SufD [Caulobacter sp.]
MSLSTALKTGDVTLLPSRRDENWRWTDLRALIRDLPAGADAETVGYDGPFAALGGQERVWVNGHAGGDSQITVEAGDRVAVGFRFISTRPSGNASRVSVRVRPGGRLVLLESYEAAADGAIAAVDLDIEVQDGGRMERIVLAADQAQSITVSIAEVTLGAAAAYAQTLLTTGARRQRLETRVAHPGADASVRLDGAYLLADQRHADLTTIVTHGGVDGATSQLTKGVVRDQARGVFQGRIVVEPGADRTDARMGHHALILSDRAEVDAKPELLIFADDVQCAHGNTIGALDKEAIFYAMQRGMSVDQARAMLTTAFVGEVIDRIEDDGAREIARGWASRQLEGAGD